MFSYYRLITLVFAFLLPPIKCEWLPTSWNPKVLLNKWLGISFGIQPAEQYWESDLIGFMLGPWLDCCSHNPPPDKGQMMDGWIHAWKWRWSNALLQVWMLRFTNGRSTPEKDLGRGQLSENVELVEGASLQVQYSRVVGSNPAPVYSFPFSVRLQLWIALKSVCVWAGTCWYFPYSCQDEPLGHRCPNLVGNCWTLMDRKLGGDSEYGVPGSLHSRQLAVVSSVCPMFYQSGSCGVVRSDRPGEKLLAEWQSPAWEGAL